MTPSSREPSTRQAERIGRAVVRVLQAVSFAVLTVVLWRGWQANAAWTAAGGWGRVLGVQDEAIARFDDQVGWVHRPGTAMTYRPGVTWRIDASGLRGEVAHPFAQPEGRRRIALLGDSFVFGNVSFGDTLGERLAARLPHTDVLNMGVSGFGVGQMLAFHERYGHRWDVDLVIVAFIEDDLERALRPIAPHGLHRPQYAQTSDGLVATNLPLPPPREEGTTTVAVGDFLRFVATWIVRGQARHPHAHPDDHALPFAILDELARTVRARGREVLLVHLPIDGGRPGRDFGFDAFCRAHDLPCLDLHDPMHGAAGEGGFAGLFLPDRHYNPAGNDLAARLLADHLLDHGWPDDP